MCLQVCSSLWLLHVRRTMRLWSRSSFLRRVRTALSPLRYDAQACDYVRLLLMRLEGHLLERKASSSISW